MAIAEMVKGVQDAGTITVTKHYIGNEQEHGLVRYLLCVWLY